MKKFPEVQPINRYQGSLDDISVNSDLSSVPNEGRGKGRYPFVPYRINEMNMAKMDALFEKGYEHQVAASLPNVQLMSKYGFSDYNPKLMEGLMDHSDSDDDMMNQDDDDVSTLSSGTRSRSEADSYSYQLSKDSSRTDLSAPIARSFSSQHRQTKRPHTFLQTNPVSLYPPSPEHTRKVARQFAVQQPKNEGDLLPLVDDDTSSVWSQTSSSKGRRGASGLGSTGGKYMVSTAPHRMIKELRSSHGNQSGQEQRLHTTGGMFMSDALVTGDNFDTKAGKSVRPQSFMSPTKAIQPMSTTDLASYLSALDPLANNLHAYDTQKMGKSIAQEVYTEEKQWAEYGDSDEEAEDRAIDKISEDINEDSQSYTSNVFEHSKKLRMKAEKLIDHSFIQKFFLYKQKNIALIQDLLQRLEQLFELLDPEKSGYISFEAFTRLLIAVAPKHIIRQDIEAFVQAQTKNLQDMVDYNEFIISGKVLLLTKGQVLQMQPKSRLHGNNTSISSTHVNDLQGSTKTWLKRQKEITGDSSTYTWKNHVEWYTKRKAQAIIWLIRRATRAFDHEVRLFEAKKVLHLKAKHAIAMSYLIEMGRLALNQADKCKVARKRLLKRVIHARYFIIKLQRTHDWLKNVAINRIKEEEYLERVKAVKAIENEAERKEQMALLNRPKQADYGSLYKVKVMQDRAITYLKGLAKKSRIHTDKQNETRVFLIAYAQRVQDQLIIKDRARRELILRAEQAYEFCITQDQVLLGLLRVGSNALQHFDKQSEALQWLLQRGPEAIKFLSYQSSATVELYQMGRRTLDFLNTREDAFAYLNRRREKSKLFIEKKAEAIAFLRQKPYKLWDIIDNCHRSQEWLAKKACRAKDHIIQRYKCQQYLQYVAGKAKTSSRRLATAHEELCQIGLISKFESFKKTLKTNKRMQKFLRTEIKQIKKADAEAHKVRKSMNILIRNKIELREAFNILCTVCTPNHILHNKSYMKKMEDLVADQNINSVLTAALGQNYTLNNSSYLSSLTPSKAATMTNNLNRSTLTSYAVDSIPNTQIAYMLGRFGLRRLFNHGKLLNQDVAAIDEFFRNADLSSNGYISFNEILPWWKVQMTGKPHIKYTLNDILPAHERAAIIVFKRMLREAQEENDEDNEYLKMKRKLLSQASSDDDDEDDEDMEEDSELDSEEEESLMSDVNKLQNIDVAKLMRYLTKRRKAVGEEGGSPSRSVTQGGALVPDDNSSIASADTAELDNAETSSPVKVKEGKETDNEGVEHSNDVLTRDGGKGVSSGDVPKEAGNDEEDRKEEKSSSEVDVKIVT
ncbi:EF-hand domain-containing protein [archaeon]|nr:MAG: EF-hand domain-containing protein [archaeon]